MFNERYNEYHEYNATFGGVIQRGQFWDTKRAYNETYNETYNEAAPAATFRQILLPPCRESTRKYHHVPSSNCQNSPQNLLWKSVLRDPHHAERPRPAKEELELCGKQLKEEGE